MKTNILYTDIFGRRIFLAAVLLLCGIGLGATPLRVVTTTGMITDMVESVGGVHVDVTGMMGPGVDPHLYKATASDIAALSRAEVIFYNGLHLEGRLGDLFVKMARRKKSVWAVTEDIAEDRLLSPDEFEGHHDPHVWFDPQLWADCALTVARALAETDPDNAEHYLARGEAVRADYLALHVWALDRVAQLDKSRRVLITSHDAFNYFGHAYEFEVVGVQGISTVTEAGLADVANTVDFIRARKVKAIFVESSVSPAAINRISRDSGAVIGGELYSDAMGTPGEIEQAGGESYDVGTYAGMIRHNIITVVESLK